MNDQPSVSFTIDRHKQTGGYQLCIVGSDGCGYRLVGPKCDGNSHVLLSHKLTSRDAQEIRHYLDEVFPINP